MGFLGFSGFLNSQKPEKPEKPKLIKQIIYIDNKRLMILQSNSADILSDTLKKSAEIHVSPKINTLFLTFFIFKSRHYLYLAVYHTRDSI